MSSKPSAGKILYRATHPSVRATTNSTFHSDICVEYDLWCKANCKDVFVIHAIDAVEFGTVSELERFVERFWYQGSTAEHDGVDVQV